jgi:hypothetical protein
MDDQIGHFFIGLLGVFWVVAGQSIKNNRELKYSIMGIGGMLFIVGILGLYEVI